MAGDNGKMQGIAGAKRKIVTIGELSRGTKMFGSHGNSNQPGLGEPMPGGKQDGPFCEIDLAGPQLHRECGGKFGHDPIAYAQRSGRLRCRSRLNRGGPGFGRKRSHQNRCVEADVQ